MFAAYSADELGPLRLPVVNPLDEMSVPAGEGVAAAFGQHGGNMPVQGPRSAAVCGVPV